MFEEAPLTVLAAVTVINTGGTIIVDGGDRAALVSSAATADATKVGFHETVAESPAVVVLGSERFDALQLTPGGSWLPAAVAVNVDEDPFVGMSRAGRAATARHLAIGEDPGALRRPGHLSPLRASPGGLVTRVGLAEGAADLMRLAGQPPAALVSFLLDESGARTASELGAPGGVDLPVVTLQELRAAVLVSEEGSPESDVESLFVDAMVRMPSGVAVVTTADEGGTPVGLVVSSLTSYSSDPPSIVVSIAHASRSHAALSTAEHFGVNMLAAEQANLAKAFASRSDDKFGQVSWRWEGGVPCLDEVQTFLRCRRTAQFSFGDHTLIVGAIVAGGSRAVPPLVYVNRGFDWRLA